MSGVTRLFAGLMLVALLVSACRPVQAPAAPAAPAATAEPTVVPAPAAKPMPIADAKMELKSGKIPIPALAGNLLGDPITHTVNILLPPSYASSDRRYPVVYVLPWGSGDPTDNTYGFKAAMERLLRQGDIPEMIVVVPDGSTAMGLSLFRSSPVTGDFEAFAARDLVDTIDANYRTLAAPNSRGLTGCSVGGHTAMRLGLTYPNVFSVVAPASGGYNDTPWQSDLEAVKSMTALPTALSEVDWANFGTAQYYIQAAASAAPNLDKPPFYVDMPFRIVDGHGEFVPEVLQKIVDQDATHEAQRYVEQPLRLRGILIQSAANDMPELTENERNFDRLLTELGVEHTFAENQAGHCGFPWEAEALKYMAGLLDFQQP